MTNQEVRRELSEAQRHHVTPLIRAWQASAAKLEAVKSVAKAQVETAQAEFDEAHADVNAFVRYCGHEHNIAFDDGSWDFDVFTTCFVKKTQAPPLEEYAPQIAHTNGERIADAQNLT